MVGFYDCWSYPCHHGVCVNGVDTFTCECEPGFEGDLCEVDIDECVLIDGPEEEGRDRFRRVCAEHAVCEDSPKVRRRPRSLVSLSLRGLS